MASVENDLARIKGIGPKYAEMLKSIGVDSVKELRHRNPQNLKEMIETRHGAVIGLSVAQLTLPDVEITGLVRDGHKMPEPVAAVTIQADDVLVLSGTPAAVAQAEHTLRGTP